MQEILLTRIFSLTIWYHLAYLTISTALLGFAAAGSILASRPRLLARGAGRLAAFAAAGAGLALLVAVWALGPNPIDPDRLRSAPARLFLGLLAYYASVAVPFLGAGLAVAAPLAAYPAHASRLYAADLLGAGLGCAAAVAALRWLDGPAALAACSAVFLLAAAAYAPERRLAWRFGAAAALLLALAPFANRALVFLPAETKALGRALRDPRTEMLFTRWSPVNRVDVYHSGEQYGGWWGINGLSAGYAGPRPRTLAIQYDGHNGTDIYAPRGLEMLDHHLLRTPYAVRRPRHVLVIGVGGGIDVQNALRQGAERVTGVDLQPITIELHRGLLAPWTGDLAGRAGVELVASEGRHFVRSSRARYDLIQITAVDTFAAQTTGAYVLAESYLYTVEAFEDYLRHLSEDGMISVLMGDVLSPNLPPPLVTRLAMVAREALERVGVADPARQLLLVAQPRATASDQNLMVKRTPFTAEELAQARTFAEDNGFQVQMAPGDGANVAIGRVVHAPAAELDRVLATHPFVLDSSTDDRPFFFNVLRWRSLATGERIFWIFPGSATGLLVLLMMLVQALLVGGALILLPLRRHGGGALPRAAGARFLLYFLGLGLGFMLVEISFVQKYVLLLGYPTYSLSVTIFSLLVFAACGALLCRRFWGRPRRFLGWLLTATAALVVLEISLLPWIREVSLAAPLPVRIATTVLLQLPLGVALGMYFPTGLEWLRRAEPGLVPWAWAVNGVASVTATVLAVILGIELGFSRVALLAVGAYAVGTLALIPLLPAGEDASVQRPVPLPPG
jgi:hypothetical protein